MGQWRLGNDEDDNQKDHKDFTLISFSSDCFRGVADEECGVNVDQPDHRAGENFLLRENFASTRAGHFGGLVEEHGERIVQNLGGGGGGGEEETKIQPVASLTLDNHNCSVD